MAESDMTWAAVELLLFLLLSTEARFATPFDILHIDDCWYCPYCSYCWLLILLMLPIVHIAPIAHFFISIILMIDVVDNDQSKQDEQKSNENGFSVSTIPFLQFLFDIVKRLLTPPPHLHFEHLEAIFFDGVRVNICCSQCPAGTRTRPATPYFFRYPIRPDSVLEIIG